MFTSPDKVLAKRAHYMERSKAKKRNFPRDSLIVRVSQMRVPTVAMMLAQLGCIALYACILTPWDQALLRFRFRLATSA
eukprot:138132-Amphidinium_carterae.1